MSEREVVLDQPVLFDEAGEAVRKATERAEKAEAELAKLKNAAAHQAASPAPAKPKPAAQDAEPAPNTHAGSSSGDATLKDPPSPSSAHAASAVGNTGSREQGHAPRDPETEAPSDGEAELRKDSMMVHLLDSLNQGKDIGHYGRLTFAMVARHFLPHEEVVGWLTRDNDFDEEQANLMLHQVEGRDYSPPKRDRILQWQKEQEFPILPYPDDPDCGNLYRNLKFPEEIYSHISHYQEKKLESAE
jgi:hypothetical protein